MSEVQEILAALQPPKNRQETLLFAMLESLGEISGSLSVATAAEVDEVLNQTPENTQEDGNDG